MSTIQGLRRSDKSDCYRAEVCEVTLCICSRTDHYCHSEHVLDLWFFKQQWEVRLIQIMVFLFFLKFVSNPLHNAKLWRHVIDYMYHDFEILPKSRSLQLSPMFRQLSLDQSPLHVTLPMSIWFFLHTNVIYRLVVFPSKNSKPTINSHSILIIKFCNIIQLLLFSFILMYPNSHQQQGLALFSKTSNQIWLLQVPLVHWCLFLCSSHFHSSPPLFHIS